MKKIITISAIFIIAISMSLSAQEEKSYYFSSEVEGSFEEVLALTKEALKEQGFGIITEIEMDKTLKEKLDNVEMLRYTILGACNPKYAYETLQAEENIGLFLPCKVLVKEVDEGMTEVVMVNPSELMKMLHNEELSGVADDVTRKFKRALNDL